MAIFDKKTSNSAKATSDKENTVIPTATFRSVLVQPRISEKASKSSESGKYVFVVTGSANKIEIKKAVEQSYKVKVVQVNIIRMQGKKKNSGKTPGKTSDFKKAIVTLKKGEKIEGATETA